MNITIEFLENWEKKYGEWWYCFFVVGTDIIYGYGTEKQAKKYLKILQKDFPKFDFERVSDKMAVMLSNGDRKEDILLVDYAK